MLPRQTKRTEMCSEEVVEVGAMAGRDNTGVDDKRRWTGRTVQTAGNLV